MNNLDMVTKGIDELPSEDTRNHLLLRQLNKSADLTAEIARFERNNKRNQTCEWLYRALQTCVERKRRASSGTLIALPWLASRGRPLRSRRLLVRGN